MNTFWNNYPLLCPIKEVLKNHQHFFAHISEVKTAETLAEHSDLVITYAIKLIEDNRLTIVLNQLVEEALTENNLQNCEGGKDFIFSLFYGAILYHDLGKVNENFQYDKMNNRKWFSKKEYSFQPISGHALPGAFLFIQIFIEHALASQWSHDEKCKFLVICMSFAYVIYTHHSSRLQNAFQEYFFSQFNDYYSELNTFFEQLNLSPHTEILEQVIRNMGDIQSHCLKDADFSLFALLKLCSSLLTASDYLATHEYMNDAPTTDFGVWNDRARIETLIKNLRSYKHNARIFEQIETMEMEHPTQISNKNLNRLRSEMAVETIRTLRKNTDKRLFYLEAPTGGGKTNLSMIATAELLEKNPTINKVFYVFPFTTLITQTCKALSDSFGLLEYELGELHSKASISHISDDDYGSKYKDYIDRLFGYYPLSVMSHVRFFDILKGNGKESNYLLHRIANSIVVIDELQSYNPLIWDRMLYLLNEYSRLFNIRFILMSATLPRIDKLKIDLPFATSFTELLPNSEAYLRNPNFADRIKFRFDLLNREENIEIGELVDVVIDKSNRYRKDSKTESVHTIVEFIYKKSATAFYEEITNDSHPFDYIFVLSGTVLDTRRKDIVSFLKNPENRKYNILLLTTQVVEAGVDIDMDLGFKNVSLIDSDEQLGGRVNRNANKEQAEVYLFRMDNAETLYKGDLRYQIMRENISMEEHERILRQKDFGLLYKKVFEKKDKINASSQIRNFKSMFIEKGIRKLDFDFVNREFELIKASNTTVFVPIDLPLEGDISEEPIFLKSEIDFLEIFGIDTSAAYIKGAEIWMLYESFIKLRSKKFDLSETINFKILNRIMSKYTFSIFTYSADMQNLIGGLGEEKYGYFYFSHWNNTDNGAAPYSLEGGLNSDALKTSNFI